MWGSFFFTPAGPFALPAAAPGGNSIPPFSAREKPRSARSAAFGKAHRRVAQPLRAESFRVRNDEQVPRHPAHQPAADRSRHVYGITVGDPYTLPHAVGRGFGRRYGSDPLHGDGSSQPRHRPVHSARRRMPVCRDLDWSDEADRRRKGAGAVLYKQLCDLGHGLHLPADNSRCCQPILRIQEKTI